MSLTINLYTKPGCPKCKLTKHLFDHHNITYIEHLIDPDTNEKALSSLKAQGYQSFPVVQVFQDSSMILDWCDFHPNQITRLAKLVAGDAHAA